jgi:hypothetical protein
VISAAPLRSGVYRGWLLVPALGLFLAGCTSPARQILTSSNNYVYWHARNAERCPADTEFCKASTVTLNKWFKALQEAREVIGNGGALPLQLQALKRVEKETKKWPR